MDDFSIQKGNNLVARFGVSVYTQDTYYIVDPLCL